MNWLKRSLRRWTNDEKITYSINSQETINFSVHRANGGYVIELRVYDSKTDKNKFSLHIIKEDEDFAARIGQIVYYEVLRQ